MNPGREDDPILAAFARTVDENPAATLVEGPGRAVSRAGVDALARRVEALLPPLDRGALVVFSAPNGPAFLAGLLALRRRGLVAVLAGARAPEAEVGRAARRLRASGILRCASGWPEGGGAWSWSAMGDPASALRRDDLAVVKLTSGSTGEPRGVATPAAALVADDASISETMGIPGDDRLLAAIPMSHSYGLSSLAVPALVRGNVLVVPEENGGPWGGLEAAVACGATVLPTVPAFLEALTRLECAPPTPAALRLVIAAGAPLSPDTAARFRERFGLPVHVFYGSSETGGICYDRSGEGGIRGTVGEPMARVAVELDAEEGTVVVRSPAVAAGYLPDPCGTLGGGVYRARDAARWEGAELRLLGREDWINVKGLKVDPREVEAVLRSIPGVEEAAVVGVDEPGCVTAMVRAVVACGTACVARETILARCRETLAPHKVPRSVVIVVRLPRTERGKIDRAALLALDAAGTTRVTAARE